MLVNCSISLWSSFGSVSTRRRAVISRSIRDCISKRGSGHRTLITPPTFKLYFQQERFNTLGTGDGYNRSRRRKVVAVPYFLTTGLIRVTAALPTSRNS
jgi:hypothetical protein